MIKCGIADAEFCQGSILTLLLTADFVSIQQKLSSLFTMESDCPERIGQMEHFPKLDYKARVKQLRYQDLVILCPR